MKSSGFDIEKTHLNKIERVEKLILMIMVAFCYEVGIYLHSISPIQITKTQKKQILSIFNYTGKRVVWF